VQLVQLVQKVTPEQQAFKDQSGRLDLKDLKACQDPQGFRMDINLLNIAWIRI
jgi:hypothetical protein